MIGFPDLSSEKNVPPSSVNEVNRRDIFGILGLDQSKIIAVMIEPKPAINREYSNIIDPDFVSLLAGVFDPLFIHYI